MDDLTWNYPMKKFFLVANFAMITVKMLFTHFHSSSYQGNIFLHQNHASCYSKLKLRKGSQTNKDYWRKFVTKLYLVSIAKNKDPSIRVKIHQTCFLLFCHYLPYICWVGVIYLICLIFLKSPWWPAGIFCAPNPLTSKIK